MLGVVKFAAIYMNMHQTSSIYCYTYLFILYVNALEGNYFTVSDTFSNRNEKLLLNYHIEVMICTY